MEFFDGMKRSQMMTPGTLIFGLLAFSPIVIWLSHGPDSVRDPWVAMAKTCAFLAISTLAVNYILAVRWSVLEDLFFGLDRMYRVHKAMGRSSLFFMVLHPVFLGISKIPKWDVIATYVVPIGPLEVSAGVVALYVFIILLALTVGIRISYHRWHLSHKLMGVVLVLALLHAVFAGSDLGSFSLLRYWVILLCTGGILSWLYMLIFYKLVGPRHNSKVMKASHLETMTELLIEKPEGFEYMPGQYIFLRFPRFEGFREMFPFSISNDPNQRFLRVSIGRSGDYTSEKIPLVRKGDEVIIMGPYGKFGKRYLEHDRDMVWIAGGIGITPFLSLARHESVHPTGRDINLIWVYKDMNDPTHDRELLSDTRSNRNFSFDHWISSKMGRIDADAVSEIVGGDKELKKRIIMLCGPPKMVASMSRQLHEKGIPYRHILYEDFDMLD